MRRYICTILLVFASVWASAQTLNQAKAWYEAGDYEKAKPVFKRMVKSSPSNGKYNLWYGVCCLETGETDLAIKHLETAVKRRTQSGQLWLGKAYDTAYRFDEAITTFEEYIEALEKLKRSTDVAEALLAKSKMGRQMTRGVERVSVIDSIVVDKDEFLNAYHISPESGRLFIDEKLGEGIAYITELKNKLYYAAMQPDSTMSILSCDKRPDGWSKPAQLSERINANHNANYPYLLSDGITIYYAADGEDSFGGYDIFITRFNIDMNDYLYPENVGMPFNSPFNDYMMVIDEYSNLGWFASDRYQPEGKVCVYVFVPNTSKRVYDVETMEPSQLIRLAKLTSIRDTWQDEELVESALQSLQALRNYDENNKEKKEKDFEFIINDQLTYHHTSDFRSEKAKQHFRNYCQLELDYLRMEMKINDLRTRYAEGNASEKSALTPSILDMEKRLITLREEVKRAEIETRNAEIETLK